MEDDWDEARILRGYPIKCENATHVTERRVSANPLSNNPALFINLIFCPSIILHAKQVQTPTVVMALLLAFVAS